MKQMNELYIPPMRITRNPKNGRYLKGHIPFSKGKKWNEWMPVDSIEKSLKGLESGRGLYKGKILPPSIARRKKVIAIKDNQIFGVFDSIHDAGGSLHMSYKDISRCCNVNHNRTGLFRRVKSINFFFEGDYELWKTII